MKFLKKVWIFLYFAFIYCKFYHDRGISLLTDK